MRVLFVTNTFPPNYTGGAEVSLYHTCRGLIGDDVACSVLHVNNRRDTTDDGWYDLDGIPVHRVQFHTKWPWHEVVDNRIVRTVRREIQAWQPDIVHVHNVSGASLAPFVAGRLEGAPVVNTLHDHWLLCPNNMLYRHDGTVCDPATHPNGCGQCLRRYEYWAAFPQRRRIFAKLTANVRLFVTSSQALIHRHIEAGYDRHRFRHIRHGIEEMPIPAHCTNPTIAHICDTAQHYRTILFAGGGVEIKGAHVLLQAIPHLLDSIDNLRIVVAGGGDIENLTRFRQFAPHVQLVGRVPFAQMRALYAAAELVLFPSVWPESYSMVIYEGYQVGTPAVGSAFGAVPELIEEGVTGYLFPRNDAAALASKILFHLQRPAQERRRMRQRCLEYARTKLSLANHVAALRSVYQEAMN